MSKKLAITQFVMLPRDLVRSDAWRSLGINAFRVVSFLISEHLAKGGKENGKLKAPHRQLVAYGVAARFATGAIAEAETKGLVICNRGGMRVATTFALAWLPLHDGSLTAEPWRQFRDPSLAPLPAPKVKNLPNKGEAGLPNKGEADRPNLPNKGEAVAPQNLPNKGEALYRKDLSLQVGDDSLCLLAGDAPEGGAA